MKRYTFYCPACAEVFVSPRGPRLPTIRCPACGATLSGGHAWFAEAGRPELTPMPGYRLAGYTLKRKLGLCPDGFLYEGESRRVRVAVKVFPAELAETNWPALSRVFEKARILADLHHGRVVGVLDMGRTEQYYFLVLELLGGDLRALLQRRDPPPVEKVIRLTYDLLTGLRAVHGAGLTHGDLRPQSILFEVDGTAKLGGFERVQSVQSMNEFMVTPGGRTAGPAHYMAPERAVDARQADIRSDLYSLGITLWETFAGRVPYGGDSPSEIVLKHLNEPLPLLEGVRPRLPSEICSFIAGLTAKDPRQRPQTPEESLGQLEELSARLTGENRRQRAGSSTPGKGQASVALRAVVWFALAGALLAAAAIPPVWMFAHGRTPELISAEKVQDRRVLVLVGAPDVRVSPERANAVRALLAYRARAVLGGEPVDPFLAAELMDAGQRPVEIARLRGAAWLLRATAEPGAPHRWDVELLSNVDRKGAALSRSASAGDTRDELEAIGAAAEELLSTAAARLDARHPPEPAHVPDLDAEGWVCLAKAFVAEREARCGEAALLFRQAAARARTANKMIRVLAAFNEVVASVQRNGAFVCESESLQLAAGGKYAMLGKALRVLTGAEEGDVETALADYLAEYPDCARGTFLLGLWRFYGRADASSALFSMRRAVEIDPGYLPAALVCVEILADAGEEAPEFFVSEHERRYRMIEKADRMREHLRNLGRRETNR